MRGNVFMYWVGIVLVLVGCQAVEPSAAPTEPAVVETEEVAVMATATTEPTAEPTAVPVVPTRVTVPTNTPEPTSELMENQPVIIYKQSGGFAGIEQEWRIFASGLYEGAPATRRTLPAEKIAQILADARAGGFFELDDSYIDEGHCCDFFNLEVTLVAEDGRSHTVTTMEQTPGMPEILKQTIDAINLLLFFEEAEE
jgi:hypothetical protein